MLPGQVLPPDAVYSPMPMAASANHTNAAQLVGCGGEVGQAVGRVVRGHGVVAVAAAASPWCWIHWRVEQLISIHPRPLGVRPQVMTRALCLPRPRFLPSHGANVNARPPAVPHTPVPEWQLPRPVPGAPVWPTLVAVAIVLRLVRMGVQSATPLFGKVAVVEGPLSMDLVAIGRCMCVCM